jgi:DNA-binding NarL/FixJ family response regulator
MVAELRQRAPDLRMVWMTCIGEDFLLEEAFAANLPGFVHKEDPLDVLFAAIEIVASGGRYYSESIVRRRRVSRADPDHYSRILSNREQEVLKLIGAGFSNPEGAAMLGLSASTVQSHCRNIMARLDLHTAAELQAYALNNGFVDVTALRVHQQAERAGNPPLPPTAFGSTPPAR